MGKRDPIFQIRKHARFLLRGICFRNADPNRPGAEIDPQYVFRNRGNQLFASIAGTQNVNVVRPGFKNFAENDDRFAPLVYSVQPDQLMKIVFAVGERRKPGDRNKDELVPEFVRFLRAREFVESNEQVRWLLPDCPKQRDRKSVV